ncbi:myozenin-2-like isoform 1-T1 [Aplochiton taeniatus]
MMMQSQYDDQAKHRMMQAKAFCKEVRGGSLNLGKKISIPRDVMMEELNLPSNRGSRMFQERLKRVERYTLENTANNNMYNNNVPVAPPPTAADLQGGKENQAYPIPGKHSLLINLQKTVAKKGSPNVLAPGYSGPLKEIPHEKFNMTVIPKSYCSPWREALGPNEEPDFSLGAQLTQPPQKQQPANYRCFNRAAMPFGGATASQTVIPVILFEALDSKQLPGTTLDRMHRRPNFNRAPRGWGMGYSPETTDL